MPNKNIQTLTTEVCKVLNNIRPPIIKTFFDLGKTDTISENPKKEAAENKNYPKQHFTTLLSYGLLSLPI